MFGEKKFRRECVNTATFKKHEMDLKLVKRSQCFSYITAILINTTELRSVLR